MSWSGDVAAEIDRVVVAAYETVGGVMAKEWPFPNAHPAVLQGIGAALLRGPVGVGGLQATYPYLPESTFAALVQNNVEEGVVARQGDALVLTEAGGATARRITDLFHEAVTAMWARRDLRGLEAATNAATAHIGALVPLMIPSACSVQLPLLDQAGLAPRLFRQLNALRYWRADAHRAAWANAGLTVAEAHALNRLWDLHRAVERVGQGDPRPGRTGVAALTARGFADGERITDAGIAAREAIEADTDAANVTAYERLDEPTRLFLVRRLRELPIH